MPKNIIADYLLNAALDLKLTKDTDEANRLISIVCEIYEEFVALLSPEQKLLYEKYCNAKDDYTDAVLNRHFSEGFKAGILFGMEIKE